MILLLTVILAFLYSSLVEYCLHRFILHSSYRQEHVKNHHRIFHGLKSYELDEVISSDVLSTFGEILRNAAFYFPPATLFFINEKYLGILFFIVCLLYNLWEEFLHLYFHKRSEVFITKYKMFQDLKEHHRVHHYIYNSNYGIGTSFWDLVFRTKRYS